MTCPALSAMQRVMLAGDHCCHVLCEQSCPAPNVTAPSHVAGDHCCHVLHETTMLHLQPNYGMLPCHSCCKGKKDPDAYRSAAAAARMPVLQFACAELGGRQHSSNLLSMVLWH